MSHFYATIDSTHAQATKCGTKSSGLTTHAAGWKGAIRVHVTHNASTGNDEFTVELVPWKGSGGTPEVLARGVLDSNVKAEGLAIVAPDNRAELQKQRA